MAVRSSREVLVLLMWQMTRPLLSSTACARVAGSYCYC